MIQLNKDITTLRQRFDRLSVEIDFQTRKRKEYVENVVRALSSISDEDMEYLRSDLPELDEIRKFTVEELLANANNEDARLEAVYHKLATLLDRWLSAYEAAL